MKYLFQQKEAVEMYAQGLQMKRVGRLIDFEYLQPETKRKKLQAYNFMRRVNKSKYHKGINEKYQIIAKAMAPSCFRDFELEAEQRKNGIYSSPASKTLNGLFEILAELFCSAVTREERLHVLAPYAAKMPHGDLVRHIPNLSRYFYYEARKLGLSGSLKIEDKVDIRYRCSKKAVSEFVHFFSRYKLSVF